VVVLVRFHVGAQDGVHAGSIAAALGPEPVQHVGIDAQVHGFLAGRHDNARVPPEILVRLNLRRILSGRHVVAPHDLVLKLGRRGSLAIVLLSRSPAAIIR
jgi:hypothetical protein